MLTRPCAMICGALLALGCASAAPGGSARVAQDEAAIRQVFDDWVRASKEGDLPLARRLIADDAVFLVPGVGEMDRESFAAAATASDPNTDFALDCTLQEIRVVGDHAWMRTKMTLVMTNKSSGQRTVMAGHGLSILERRGEAWVIIRDANTAVPAPG